MLPLRKYALPSIPMTVPLIYQDRVLNNFEERDRETLDIKKSWVLCFREAVSLRQLPD